MERLKKLEEVCWPVERNRAAATVITRLGRDSDNH
jgi:hypothetical protein